MTILLMVAVCTTLFMAGCQEKEEEKVVYGEVSIVENKTEKEQTGKLDGTTGDEPEILTEEDKKDESQSIEDEPKEEKEESIQNDDEEKLEDNTSQPQESSKNKVDTKYLDKLKPQELYDWYVENIEMVVKNEYVLSYYDYIHERMYEDEETNKFIEKGLFESENISYFFIEYNEDIENQLRKEEIYNS